MKLSSHSNDATGEPEEQRTVKTSSKVKTASINTPCTKLVPVERVVLTLKSVGKRTLTRKEAKILPPIWADTRSRARKADMDRVIAMARVTYRGRELARVSEETDNLQQDQ
jgi:hypothetical protein